MNLTKLANVLDAMADYVEENERKQASAQTAARKARLDKLATAHLQAHGEEMSDAVRNKLSSTDESTLDVVEDLLSKQAGAVTPLGSGSDLDADPEPKTTKEAADVASQRFLEWINS